MRRLARRLGRREELIALEGAWAWNPRSTLDEVVGAAQAIEAETVSHRRLLDCSGGEGASVFGHCRPELTAAFVAGLRRGGSCLGADPLYASNCARIARLAALERAVILPSDGHLVDLLAELVDAWAVRERGLPKGAAWLAFSRQGTSGCSLLSCAFGDDFRARTGFGPFPPNSEIIDAGSLPALAKNLDVNPHIAAFVLNPLPLRGGLRPPSADYLRDVGRVCADYGVLLVCDERFSGGGRTGAFCFFQHFGMAPDAVLLGGGLTGGLAPLGVLAARAALLPALQPLVSDPAVLAALEAGLVLVEDARLLQSVREKGALLLGLLREAVAGLRIVADVRGVGVMLCVQIWSIVDETEMELVAKLCARGLLASWAHNHIYILPPIDLTFEHCYRIADIVRTVFGEYY